MSSTAVHVPSLVAAGAAVFTVVQVMVHRAQWAKQSKADTREEQAEKQRLWSTIFTSY